MLISVEVDTLISGGVGVAVAGFVIRLYYGSLDGRFVRRNDLEDHEKEAAGRERRIATLEAAVVRFEERMAALAKTIEHAAEQLLRAEAQLREADQRGIEHATIIREIQERLNRHSRELSEKGR